MDLGLSDNQMGYMVVHLNRNPYSQSPVGRMSIKHLPINREKCVSVAMAPCISISACASIQPPRTGTVSPRTSKCLESVRNLVKSTRVQSIVTPPCESLHKGNWVKLICGASFEDVVDIRNLSLVYTLAGVDCIDCAADESVVRAVNQGVDAAQEIVSIRRPWVMISVNDDEDLHFRKAEFDPQDCPIDCSRPCEIVCPANAIPSREEMATANFVSVNRATEQTQSGVITERCYGCGRCLPVCPYDKISAISYMRDATTTAELLKRNDIDAIEIHTNGRQTENFEVLWHGLGKSVDYLKLVAVSLPFSGDLTLCSMKTMYSVMEPQLQCLNLWQLDGRPMSGDIGKGATKETISFAVHMAAANDKPHGLFQLAGGTNAHTVEGLKREGFFRTQFNESSKNARQFASAPASSYAFIGGIAFGGYARKIVGRVLRSMQSESGLANVEDHPEHLLEAVRQALGLVGTVKCYEPSP